MTNKALNALLGSTPKFDLVGPTVDDDVRRIVMRYGPEAVKESVKRQTKPQKGRPPEKDWPLLREALEADARHWLEGRDPFSLKTNHSVAREFADKHPGQSHPSTMKRITRKLAKKRKIYMLYTAESMGRDSYPYGSHLKTLEEICKINSIMDPMLKIARDSLRDYEAKFGEAPSPDLTMEDIERANQNALIALDNPRKPGGLFGIAHIPKSKGE